MLFILHADHEQNCSSTTMRVVGSAQADPYLATAAAASALSGPLHGGANEEVLRMLDEIGSINHIPEYIKRVKGRRDQADGLRPSRVQELRSRAPASSSGWPTRCSRSPDAIPRLDIALELERIALQDDYFVSRKLYPNVDFYSGIIYQAMGFQPEMFTVLFAIPRTAGWLAQWNELMDDPEQKIARPRQIYTGVEHRKVHAKSRRPQGGNRAGAWPRSHRATGRAALFG